MREIKFRVWDVKDKCWDNPALLEVWDNSGRLRHLYDFEAEKTIIQQFTGLLDKNNKEIYEGDIIGYFNEKYEIFADLCSMYLKNGELIGTRVDDIPPKEMIVIGNIFENPELLEK